MLLKMGNGELCLDPSQIVDVFKALTQTCHRSVFKFKLDGVKPHKEADHCIITADPFEWGFSYSLAELPFIQLDVSKVLQDGVTSSWFMHIGAMKATLAYDAGAKRYLLANLTFSASQTRYGHFLDESSTPCLPCQASFEVDHQHTGSSLDTELFQGALPGHVSTAYELLWSKYKSHWITRVRRAMNYVAIIQAV
jgi:hypothetical protein